LRWEKTQNDTPKLVTAIYAKLAVDEKREEHQAC
jgi:hypothetical protein